MGVAPMDAVTFSTTALAFAVIGIGACYVPARRALRINATEALRCSSVTALHFENASMRAYGHLDSRYALRRAVHGPRAPGFALAAIVSLGLGIGANTAIFSLLDALLLTPMPVAQPDRIATIYTSDFSSTRLRRVLPPGLQGFSRARQRRR